MMNDFHLWKKVIKKYILKKINLARIYENNCKIIRFM
jgi:hypothetical protein